MALNQVLLPKLALQPSSSPSPIALCFHHVTGSVSGSASVSSVSSSGSGEDQSQLTAPRKSNAASPKVVTRPTSPLHNRFSGMTLESSSTGRNNDGRSSEYHPLPLPPGSPTTSPSVVIMCSPTSPSSGVQGGSDSSSPLGVSKWKKGRFTESCTFGKVYQGLTGDHQIAMNIDIWVSCSLIPVTRVAMCGDEFVLYSRVYHEEGRICAIKEVKVISDDKNSKKCLKQLNQEINVLSQLCHPNIVQYYGSELVCVDLWELQEKKRYYILVSF
ncbi:hypothetical protein Bca101_057985 [Brassica carinata]